MFYLLFCIKEPQIEINDDKTGLSYILQLQCIDIMINSKAKPQNGFVYQVLM